MPLIEDKEFQSRYSRAVGILDVDDLPEEEADAIKKSGFFETMKAQMMIDNSIVGALTRNPNLPDRVIEDANFNPLNYITPEEELDDRFLDAILYSSSEDEINAVRAQKADEEKWREVRDSGSGWAVLTAELFDPINLIPVAGTGYKTYKAGTSILKAGAITGSSLAGVTAAEEAVLHYQQVTRTYGESATNVAAAGLIGSVFGMAPAAFREYAKRAGKDPDTVLKEVDYAFDPESKVANGLNPSLDQNMGAAMAQQSMADLPDIQIKGVAARSFVKKMRRFGGPLMRGMTSASSVMRKNTARLAENPTDMEVPGAAPTESSIAFRSLETIIKSKESIFYDAFQNNKRLMKEYFKTQKATDSAYAGVQGYVKSGLNRRKFNEAVGRAVRSGHSDNKYIQEASDYWRKNFYDKILKDANDVGLLVDVDTKTAVNYLNRIWDTEKIIERRPEFKKKIKEYIISKNSGRLGSANARIISKLIADDKNIDEIGELLRREYEGEAWIGEIINVDSIADEIITKITASHDGRLPYEYQIGENILGQTVVEGAGGSGSGLKGVFKERAFLIPDDMIDDFLVNDIEELAFQYQRSSITDIELVREFGDVEATSAIKDITRDWEDLMSLETDPKTLKKMNQQMNQDISDFSNMIKRMRGTFNVPESTAFGLFGQRIASTAKDLNYLRLMGGVVPSSIPDISRIVMAEGIVNVFGKGLLPMIKNLEQVKIAKEELEGYVRGVDVYVGGRADVIADTAYMTRGGTGFERAIRSAATKYSNINLMNQWTSFSKGLHGIVTQSRISDDLMKGKYDKRLYQLGINERDSKLIAEQIKKHGYKKDGVWVVGVGKWDNQDVAEKWMSAMRKESDRVIIMPGQEKPLFMSTNLGSTLFQFKSFMTVSTFRITASLLQGQDRHQIQGLIGMLGIGMMAYAFKEWNAGREVSDDPAFWVMEGIDRSGALGVITEIDNTMTKISRDSFGLRPMLGIDGNASRYASRSVLESALGPSFGLAGDSARVLSEALSSEEAGGWDLNDSDVRAIRRIMPMQNLFYLRKIFDKIESNFKE